MGCGLSCKILAVPLRKVPRGFWLSTCRRTRTFSMCTAYWKQAKMEVFGHSKRDTVVIRPADSSLSVAASAGRAASSARMAKSGILRGGADHAHAAAGVDATAHAAGSGLALRQGTGA